MNTRAISKISGDWFYSFIIVRTISAGYSLMGETAWMCNVWNVSACALAKTLDIGLWRRNIFDTQFRGGRRGSTGFAFSFWVKIKKISQLATLGGSTRTMLNQRAPMQAKPVGASGLKPACIRVSYLMSRLSPRALVTQGQSQGFIRKSL
ncbi:MAG: hypothetical protein VX350_02920, partial [Pseudomonadota bacterium]|nr:hypothetical protein [Pseudomonadota bacterium]